MEKDVISIFFHLIRLDKLGTFPSRGRLFISFSPKIK
jgi:hypothetical protein